MGKSLFLPDRLAGFRRTCYRAPAGFLAPLSMLGVPQSRAGKHVGPRGASSPVAAEEEGFAGVVSVSRDTRHALAISAVTALTVARGENQDPSK